MCNGYYILSELNDVLQSGYYESALGYKNVDWFVDQVTNLEIKMALSFRNTNKDIKMSENHEEGYRINNICRFCEKEMSVDESRENCHLTTKYTGPAYSVCNINVTQKQSDFILFAFHNFSSNDCHIFFKKLNDKKNEKVKPDSVTKTNEEYTSVTYGCIRFIDFY